MYIYDIKHAYIQTLTILRALWLILLSIHLPCNNSYCIWYIYISQSCYIQEELIKPQYIYARSRLALKLASQPWGPGQCCRDCQQRGGHGRFDIPWSQLSPPVELRSVPLTCPAKSPSWPPTPTSPPTLATPSSGCDGHQYRCSLPPASSPQNSSLWRLLPLIKTNNWNYHRKSHAENYNNREDQTCTY